MAQKKIAIILPALNPGGTERVAAELANYFTTDKNAKVTLLLMYNCDIFYDIDERVQIQMPRAAIKQKLGKVAYIPYLIYFLHKKLKQFEPDRIVCLGYILFSLMASIAISTKVFISFRCNPYKKRFGKQKIYNFFYYALHNMLSWRVDGFIAQTQAAKKHFSKRYHCPIEIIPNFLRKVSPYPQHFKKNRITYLGRLSVEKNPMDLLLAFSEFENHFQWELHFVGDGHMKSELIKKTKQLGLEKYIVFHGFVKSVDKMLSQTKILGLTSLSEGFPNAILEAMANRVVPVVYNCDVGPSDIINDGENGFLVKVGDVTGMARKFQILDRQNEMLQRMSKNAQEDAKKYDINIIGQRYYEFLFSTSFQ